MWFLLERFPLPLGAWDGLRYFIMALPEPSILLFLLFDDKVLIQSEAKIIFLFDFLVKLTTLFLSPVIANCNRTCKLPNTSREALPTVLTRPANQKVICVFNQIIY